VHPLVVTGLVKRALREDWGQGDLTTLAIVPPGMSGRATVVCRSGGVVAGLPVAECVFGMADADIRFNPLVAEGDRVPPACPVAAVEGPVAGILQAERVALNFLQRLSGIATVTREAVEAVVAYGVRILDTRKTTPTLRALERYAVRVGGGLNHRYDLGSMALIKDNHRRAAGSITEAVRRVRANSGPAVRIEVEVETLDELEEAVASGVDLVMLDNMDVATMAEAVRRVAGRVPLEASGGIRLQDLPAVAATGVNYISLGYLTTRAPSLDMSLELEPESFTPQPAEVR